MDQGFRLVAGFDQFPAFLVLLGMGLGVLDHSLDLFIGEPAGRLDAYLLFLARGLVLGRDVDDAVGVDVEGDLDLGQAARRRRNAHQVELAKQLVVRGHLAFALEHADRHRGLAVLGGREDLALLRRDRGVAVDQAGVDAAQGLDTQRQRRHVEQQNVLDVALEHARLDRRAHRHDLVRVHALMRLSAKEVLHRLDDLGHAGHAAHQDDLVNLGSLQPGVLERRLAGLHRALDQFFDQRLELGPGQFDVEMLRPGLIGGDEGKVDLGFHGAGKLDLGFFRRFFQPLQRQAVLAQVDALLLLELIGEVIDDFFVEILSPQEGVAVGRFDLEDAVADFEYGNIEGAAAEIVNGDGAAFLLLETVGERRRRRLVDDAQNLETGDAAAVLGGLAL